MDCGDTRVLAHHDWHAGERRDRHFGRGGNKLLAEASESSSSHLEQRQRGCAGTAALGQTSACERRRAGPVNSHGRRAVRLNLNRIWRGGSAPKCRKQEADVHNLRFNTEVEAH